MIRFEKLLVNNEKKNKSTREKLTIGTINKLTIDCLYQLLTTPLLLCIICNLNSCIFVCCIVLSLESESIESNNRSNVSNITLYTK